ncbi:uroporphyrinogen-III synthase [Caldibacillus lycopersici]|uniref:Uroporphyrinogen-III synthase n=1 Tax=Perspicuibacillus lycopersici TaxID=1325689 RepID=A0AAE3LNM6_9BACI|nr:uroporphyrinogen-III synthase [Perspicuibacillus lycopersici]MCU9614036.1 uroporphyrinogen-III synthase [Perspicuibacillus lycopersici]
MEENLPLAGKRCLIMRNPSQAKQLVNGIRKLGGEAVNVPLISFRKTIVNEQDQLIVKNLATYDWIIFTSQNGVRFFMEQLQESDESFPKHVKVAAVGKKTEQLLHDYGVTISFIPSQFTGEALAAEIIPYIQPMDTICIIKGNLASNIIYDELRAKTPNVHELIIYETYLPEESKERLAAQIREEAVDLLVFTSPSTVQHFLLVIEENKLQQKLMGKIFACIGPVTKKALITAGFPVHICPKIYTGEQLLKETKQFFVRK